MPLNYSGPLGSPLRVLRPVLVRYVQPFKPLIGVFDRRLDRRLVPQNILGIEARGLGISPVFVLLVAVYIFIFALCVFVKCEIRHASGPEMNGSVVINDRLEFFILA